MDVLAGAISDDRITWHENKQPINTSVETDLINQHLLVYPTPTSGLINIDSPISIDQIKIYNSIGQLVLSNRHKASIDLFRLTQGLYFCEVKNVEGDFSDWKVVKE